MTFCCVNVFKKKKTEIASTGAGENMNGTEHGGIFFSKTLFEKFKNWNFPLKINSLLLLRRKNTSLLFKKNYETITITWKNREKNQTVFYYILHIISFFVRAHVAPKFCSRILFRGKDKNPNKYAYKLGHQQQIINFFFFLKDEGKAFSPSVSAICFDSCILSIPRL